MDQPPRCFAHPTERLGGVRCRRIRLSFSVLDIPRRQEDPLALLNVAI
jgi:hypothetical protein